MLKLCRIIFLVVAARIPIIIGVMHLYIHFSKLVSPKVEDYLQKGAVISSESPQLWEIWGMTSFMMGLCFIIVGLLNSFTYLKLPKSGFPPLPSVLVMVLYYSGVFYAGIAFEQRFQLYGGLSGILALLLTLAIILRNDNKTLEIK